MEIIREITGLKAAGPCSLALGAFDGLHRGHMAVISAAVAADPENAGVLTFEDSPSGAPAVLTPGDKLSLLRAAGVRRVYSFRFQDLRDMAAEDFFEDILAGGCGAAALFCGTDFRFGRGAAGDAALLQRLCVRRGMTLRALPPVLEDGEKISSTRIRAAVAAGDLPLAERLLGRPFGYTLEVIHGNHIGAGLGTPTVNQAPPENLVLPPYGVCASLVEIDGKEWFGVTNIGVKPTVGSDRPLSETWIPDFSGDLYGRRLRLSLLRFLRPERKFPGLAQLREQIGRDAKQAREIAEEYLSRWGGLGRKRESSRKTAENSLQTGKAMIE